MKTPQTLLSPREVDDLIKMSDRVYDIQKHEVAEFLLGCHVSRANINLFFDTIESRRAAKRGHENWKSFGSVADKIVKELKK